MQIQTDPLTLTFSALADPTRRAMLMRLSEGPATVNELAAPFDVSLPSISRHLKVLEAAGLVSKGRTGQFRPCTIETAPLEAADLWLAHYRAFFSPRFDRLEAQLAQMVAAKKETDK